MKRTRGLWLSIGFVLVLVVSSVVGLLTSVKPILGLDLEGGVSVILKAPDGTPRSVLDQAVDNIRNRVDSAGVAEPEIFVTGTNIEVQLPGLARGTVQTQNKTQYCLIGQNQHSFGCYADQVEANNTLGTTKVEPKLISVCIQQGDGTVTPSCFGSKTDAQTELKAIKPQKQTTGDNKGKWCLQDTNGAQFGCFDTQKAATDAQSGLTTKDTTQYCLNTGSSTLSCYQEQTNADASLAAIKVAKETKRYCVISSSGETLGCPLSQDDANALLQQTGQEHLLELIGTTARLEEREVLGTSQTDQSIASEPVTCATVAEQATSGCSFDALQNKTVIYQGKDPSTGQPIKYKLGPVQITGDMISKATAVFSSASQTAVPEWLVDFQLTKAGTSKFAQVTTALNQKQLAIILDRDVISAPTIQEPITGGSGQITGNFNEQRARDLATVLNAGALPVQLQRQQVLTVSPTLGKESLHQAIIAGIAGLSALFLYLLFYYRLLGVVAWLGMSIWAALAMGIIGLLGRTIGYSLTLAGVAGLVISLGVTADSYIVFFERLKDEVRGGKTPRSAVQPAFKRAYRTIIAADFVTGIAALVLYVTAVSSVRGFALTLGVATLLDLFVVYMFKRPTVFLIARNQRLVNLHGFGLSSGVAAEEPEPEPMIAGGSK